MRRVEWKPGDLVSWKDSYDDRPRTGHIVDVLSEQLLIYPDDNEYPTIVKMSEPTLKGGKNG